MNDMFAKELMEKLASRELTNSFIIPDAKYLGDTFFILDTKGKVIALFAWDGGVGWFRDDTTFHVQYPKPWVGLTGTEINHIFAANAGYPERMMQEVENLLKEKNT